MNSVELNRRALVVLKKNVNLDEPSRQYYQTKYEAKLSQKLYEGGARSYQTHAEILNYLYDQTLAMESLKHQQTLNAIDTIIGKMREQFGNPQSLNDVPRVTDKPTRKRVVSDWLDKQDLNR